MAAMGQGAPAGLRYAIMDPTGNVTALVETPVEVARQPRVAGAIMARHDEVEQVGFVRWDGRDPLLPELRMAGGEFCGNATMSAAALHLIRRREAQGEATPRMDGGACETLLLRVSGVARPVEVRLRPRGGDAFDAGVRMPSARELGERRFACGELRGPLPVVRMEGISHVIIGRDSAFAWLRDDRAAAERAVRAWCAELGSDGLGLMFVSGCEPLLRLTPLVFVPGSNTVFWERSCASGSAAVGTYLARAAGEPRSLTLEEPGGTLRVESDPRRDETWLYGSTRLRGSYVLDSCDDVPRPI